MAFKLANIRSINLLLRMTSFRSSPLRSMCTGEWGSGSGKGGGTGGSIRDAGGAFGKQEAAREEEYFKRKQREQIDVMKNHLHEEIEQNQDMIRRHEEAIKKAKLRITEIEKKKE